MKYRKRRHTADELELGVCVDAEECETHLLVVVVFTVISLNEKLLFKHPCDV